MKGFKRKEKSDSSKNKEEQKLNDNNNCHHQFPIWNIKVLFHSSSDKSFKKKGSDAKKIEPLTFLINDFFPWKERWAEVKGWFLVSSL